MELELEFSWNWNVLAMGMYLELESLLYDCKQNCKPRTNLQLRMACMQACMRVCMQACGQPTPQERLQTPLDALHGVLERILKNFEHRTCARPHAQVYDVVEERQHSQQQHQAYRQNAECVACNSSTCSEATCCVDSRRSAQLPDSLRSSKNVPYSSRATHRLSNPPKVDGENPYSSQSPHTPRGSRGATKVPTSHTSTT